jgi:hypothetical protein
MSGKAHAFPDGAKYSFCYEKKRDIHTGFAMGGQQSQQSGGSFRLPVQTHIDGLFKLAWALKTQNTDLQTVAITLLKQSADQWIDKLNDLMPGAGNMLVNSFNGSMKDEVKLIFGIMHCKCGKGKFGTCENGQLIRDAFQEVEKNHTKTIQAMTMLLGDEEKWTNLWAKQLSTMDNFCIILAAGGSEKDIETAERECCAAAEEMILALDTYADQQKQ